MLCYPQTRVLIPVGPIIVNYLCNSNILRIYTVVNFDFKYNKCLGMGSQFGMLYCDVYKMLIRLG